MYINRYCIWIYVYIKAAAVVVLLAMMLQNISQQNYLISVFGKKMLVFLLCI